MWTEPRLQDGPTSARRTFARPDQAHPGTRDRRPRRAGDRAVRRASPTVLPARSTSPPSPCSCSSGSSCRLWVRLSAIGGIGSTRGPRCHAASIASRPERPDLVDRFGVWPATALFVAFTWLELVSPDSGDPSTLARSGARLLRRRARRRFCHRTQHRPPPRRGVSHVQPAHCSDCTIRSRSRRRRRHRDGGRCDPGIGRRGWLRALPVLPEWPGSRRVRHRDDRHGHLRRIVVDRAVDRPVPGGPRETSGSAPWRCWRSSPSIGGLYWAASRVAAGHGRQPVDCPPRGDAFCPHPRAHRPGLRARPLLDAGALRRTTPALGGERSLRTGLGPLRHGRLVGQFLPLARGRVVLPGA